MFRHSLPNFFTTSPSTRILLVRATRSVTGINNNNTTSGNSNKTLMFSNSPTTSSPLSPLHASTSDFLSPIGHSDNNINNSFSSSADKNKKHHFDVDEDEDVDADADNIEEENVDDEIESTTTTNNNNNNNSSSSTKIINPNDLFCPTVWQSQTIGDSWKNLHLELHNIQKQQNIDSSRKNNKKRNSQQQEMTMERLLVQHDLKALAKVTSRAEISHLLNHIFPESLRARITNNPQFDADTVEEIFIHLGMNIEMRTNAREIFTSSAVTPEELCHTVRRVKNFGDDGRACVDNTLHRVSCFMSRSGHITGVTIRVGRFIPDVFSPFLNAALKGSMLLLSAPSVGKTTMLRDAAVQLARLPENHRVIVIDTSNEIGGDSEVPLAYMSRVRRIQVPKRSQQLHYMIQAVQNHAPEWIIIDEISTKEEVDVAVSMSQRGIKLIATAHANSLHTLLQNPTLNGLVGGVANAFLASDERKQRNKVRKTILERVSASPFRTIVELQSRKNARVIRHVNDCVDLILDKNSLEEAKPHWFSDCNLLDESCAVIQQDIDSKRSEANLSGEENEYEKYLLKQMRENEASSSSFGNKRNYSSNKNQSNSNFNRKQQQQQQQNTSYVDNSDDGFLRCSRCGARGHVAKFCRKNFDKTTTTSPSTPSSSSSSSFSSTNFSSRDLEKSFSSDLEEGDIDIFDELKSKLEDDENSNSDSDSSDDDDDKNTDNNKKNEKKKNDNDDESNAEKKKRIKQQLDDDGYFKFV